MAGIESFLSNHSATTGNLLHNLADIKKVVSCYTSYLLTCLFLSARFVRYQTPGGQCFAQDHDPIYKRNCDDQGLPPMRSHKIMLLLNAYSQKVQAAAGFKHE